MAGEWGINILVPIYKNKGEFKAAQITMKPMSHNCISHTFI